MTGSATPEAIPRRDALWLALILLVTAAVYAKALTNDFTYDDRRYVSAYTRDGENPMVIEARPVADYFRYPMGYGVQPLSRGFRPLTVLSYAWTHRLARSAIEPRPHPEYSGLTQRWRDPPWPHHAINLLLHLLASALVYLIVRRLTGPGRAALGAAAVFALHALKSDQVISIVGRGELLGFVFGAAGTLFLDRALDRRGRARLVALASGGACMMAAFLGKESAVGWVVVAPLLVAAMGVARGVARGAARGAARGDARGDAKGAASGDARSAARGAAAGSSFTGTLRRLAGPFSVVVALPAVVFFVLRARMLADVEAAGPFSVVTESNPLFGMSLVERLPTAVMVWGFALWKLFVPYPLAADYGNRVFDVIDYGDLRFYGAAAALLAVLAGGVYCLRRCPMLFVATAAFLGFGFITSNIPTPIETIFGERLLYTPGLAVALLAAVLLRRFPRVTTVALAAWLAGSAALCARRTFDWQDNATLFSVDAENQPRSVAMQMNMARICRLRGDPEGRRRYLERALAADPDSLAAHNDLGVDLVAAGQHEAALLHLRRALRILENRPRFDREQYEPALLLNSASSLAALDRHGEAEALFRKLLRHPVHGLAAHKGLLWELWARADRRAVEATWRAATALAPNDPEVAVHGGLLASAAGDDTNAARILAATVPRLRRSRNALHAWFVLAKAWVGIGEHAKARQVIERFLAIPNLPGDFHARFEQLHARLPNR